MNSQLGSSAASASRAYLGGSSSSSLALNAASGNDVEDDRLSIQLNPMARKIESIMRHNPDQFAPTKLFGSKCPRVCVPLQCTQTTATATLAHEIQAADVETNPSPIAAAVLLAAARRPNPPTTFKNAYEWWFNNKTLPAAQRTNGTELQREILEELNFDYAAVVTGQVKIPRFLAYIENSCNLWLFFVDGRVNYSEMLAPHGKARSQPLFQPAPTSPDGIDASFFSALRSSVETCNQNSASPMSVLKLFNSPTLTPAFPGSQNSRTYNVEDPIVRALARFCPSDAADFHNAHAIAAAGNVRYTRVDCASSTPMNRILSLPSPVVRREYVESCIARLSELRSPTEDIRSVIETYERHMARLRRGADASFVDIAAEAAELNSVSADEEQRVEALAVAESNIAQPSNDAQTNVAIQAVSSAISSLGRHAQTITVAEQHDEEYDINNDYDIVAGVEHARSKNAASQNVRITVNDSKVYSGRMINVFGAARVQENIMNAGGGLNALYLMNPGAEAAAKDNEADVRRNLGAGASGGGDADAEGNGEAAVDDKTQSMSGNSLAMQQKFEQLNAFRQYRRQNQAKLFELSTSYDPSSDEYQREMAAFKRAALREASDTFFGVSADMDRVSAPIKDVRVWLSKNADKQLPEFPVIMKHMSAADALRAPDEPQFGPFSNFLFHLIRDLDMAYTPDSLMEDAVLLVFTAMAGAWHHNNLRPNILLCGDASVGKSYILKISAALVPDGVTFEVTHETAKAGLVDGMITDVLLTKEELNQHELGTDQYGKEREVESMQKDRLTSNLRTTYSMEICTDQKTGKQTRVQRIYHACEEMARQAATNAKLPSAKNPSLVRWIVRPIKFSSHPDHSITDLITSSALHTPPEKIAVVVDHWKAFFTIQLYIEKMIESRAISNVNMDAISEMSDLLRFVQNQYKFKVDDPKVINKLMGTCRLITVSYAIYCAVGSELGIELRRNSLNGESRTLQEVCIELALEVEKYLVLTREIVVYVFSLLRTEWMPTVRLSILETIRDLYITGKPGLDQNMMPARMGDVNGSLHAADVSAMRRATNGRQTKIEWCGPPDSRIEEYDPEGKFVDSSFIELSDLNGSTHINDVATHIVTHMQHRQASKDTVIRELTAMTQVRVQSNVYAHLKTCTNRATTKPKGVCDNRTGEYAQQEMPLFFCGRLPPAVAQRRAAQQAAAAAKSSWAPAAIGSRFGFPVAPPPPPPPNRLEEDAENANRQFGGAITNSPYEHRVFMTAGGTANSAAFACMILFDAVYAPTDQTQIVENAVNSLSHKYMSGDRQTFVLSGPTEIDIPYPDETDKSHNQRTHRLTIYTVPKTIVVEKKGCLRILHNPKPTLPYQMAISRIGEHGARHRMAMRTYASPGMDSQCLYLRNDPDLTALGLHHRKIGIDPNPNYYWNNFMRVLCDEHERRGMRYETLENILNQHRQTWVSKYLSNKATALNAAPTDEEAALLFHTVGIADTAQAGFRTMTAQQIGLISAIEGSEDVLVMPPPVQRDTKMESFFQACNKDFSKINSLVNRIAAERAEARRVIQPPPQPQSMFVSRSSSSPSFESSRMLAFSDNGNVPLSSRERAEQLTATALQRAEKRQAELMATGGDDDGDGDGDGSPAIGLDDSRDFTIKSNNVATAFAAAQSEHTAKRQKSSDGGALSILQQLNAAVEAKRAAAAASHRPYAVLESTNAAADDYESE
jgi:DNA replicative helicase MCM subunit Mcm2 (Cdc46/Mcm family)